ncbi:MAG: NAD-dependent epimerase/dehydratase family protein [Anaerolineae bacterium]
MVTALVTGATGFVGSHITRLLVEHGHTVRIVRRANSRTTLVDDLPVEHALGDVTEPESLQAAMRGCEWVFHTAAVSDYWRSSRERIYEVNVKGTQHVLDVARSLGIQRVILTSSAAAIGLRKDGRPSDETIPFNLPPNRFPYGHSKWLADELAAQYTDLEVVMLNPSVIFGPGDLNQISGSFITEFARGLVPPLYPVGRVTAIDVRDVARAHLVAAEKGRAGQRYILGESDISYKDLFGMIATMVGARPPKRPLPKWAALPLARLTGFVARLGVKLPINADQVWLSAQSVTFDCHKSHRELGLPQIPLRQSLHDTYDWYKAQGMIKAGK